VRGGVFYHFPKFSNPLHAHENGKFYPTAAEKGGGHYPAVEGNPMLRCGKECGCVKPRRAYFLFSKQKNRAPLFIPVQQA
jgi:hypothetical protein